MNKRIGNICFITGIIFCACSLSMDTSVSVDILGTDVRVNNIGLMQEKQNYLIFSCLMIIAGLLISLFGTNSFSNTDNNSSYEEWEKEQELNKQIKNSYNK